MDTVFAQVALNINVNTPFTYHVPDDLVAQIQMGQLVRVPFRTATDVGVVVALSPENPNPTITTKPIEAILEAHPPMTADQLALAWWMHQTYLTPLGMCLWLLLPPNLINPHTADLHKPTVPRIQVAEIAISPDDIPHIRRNLGKPNRHTLLLEWLINTHAEGQTTFHLKELVKLPAIGRGTVNKLIEADALHDLGDGVLALADNAEDILFDLRGGAMDDHILRVLGREIKPMDVSWLYAQTGATLDDLKRLAQAGFIHAGEKPKGRDHLANTLHPFVPVIPPRLTDDQRNAWHPIRNALDVAKYSGFLLHGVTGSGKTEIYLRAIEHTLAKGKSALFLVPEIALTAQTIQRVLSRFASQTDILGEEGLSVIGLTHGSLRNTDRKATWNRARKGDIRVIIGTRSAVFAPLQNLGLIILDEEHDHSYKQSPPMTPPYYHARSVAEFRMRHNEGVLLLGSATPDIGTYYRAQSGALTLLNMPNRILGHRHAVLSQANRINRQPHYQPTHDSPDGYISDMPPVQIVDMRQELIAGNTDMFSRRLQASLHEVFARDEQAILFLNRRGTATYVFCRDCGYIAKCPRCDTPLTHHDNQTALRCHHCGFSEPTPQKCPNCGSGRIKFFGAGTQQVESAFKTHFPHISTIRWDSDTATTPLAHEVILSRFAKQDAQVLIGTQMIAKGLDLPLVTLVGVMSADTELGLPDFRVGERTFQMLTQVAGRAGRSILGGDVILQTYQPTHYAIQAAKSHDYASFYTQEIAYRRDIGYPPFRHIIRILCQSEREGHAHDEAVIAAKMLKSLSEQTEIPINLIAPAPCFFGKINKVYRWHVLAVCVAPTRLLEGINIRRDWSLELDPLNIL
ncbi:MAG: primosomal protein N' [bacterium]|nr:primosomal protein N' [bacterium]